MTEKKEKEIFYVTDSVRIVEVNDMNVQVERHELVENKGKGTSSMQWRFKGYSDTFAGALRLIVRKELLIKRNDANNLESYLKRVLDSNELVLNAIERL